MPWTTIEFGEAQIEPGKAAVALEGGLGALRADELLGRRVELLGGDARRGPSTRASSGSGPGSSPAAAIFSTCSGVLRMIIRYTLALRGARRLVCSKRIVARVRRISSATSSGGAAPSIRRRTPALVVVVDQRLGLLVVGARAGCGSPRACRRRGRSARLPSTSQTPSCSGGLNSTWKTWPFSSQVRRPPSRRTTSSSLTSISSTAVTARPSSSSLASSASAWGIVRGKPSRMKPSSASAESIRSAITPTITSSGTRSPRSMYSLAVRPSSVSSRTAARRMSPVA